MIGPGKSIDTNKYFVICAKFTGGCFGSTSPASINKDTGISVWLRFPRIIY